LRLCQADRLRGLHIGDELKLGRLNEGNIGGLDASRWSGAGKKKPDFSAEPFSF
jgi:hypothetical protein